MRHLLAIIFLLCCSAPCWAATYYVRTDGNASCLGTTDAPFTSGTACAFNSPQLAFNAAAGGDTINIRANDSFSGNFSIPNYGAGTSYVTVQTTGTITPSGTRITPAYAAQMPKLVSPNSSSTLVTTAAGSHHYQFIGIEFTNIGGSVVTQEMIELGGDHFIFDRCWIHEATNDTTTPDSMTTTSIRGFNAHAADSTIKESRIAGFRAYQPISQGVESSQGILFAGSAARFTVYNNWIEAWFTPIFFAPSAGSPNSATITSPTYDTGTHTGSATFSNVTNLVVNDLVSFHTTGGRTPVTGNPHSDEASPAEIAKVTGIAGSVVSYIGWGSYDGYIGNGNPLLQVPDTPGEALWRGYTPIDITIQRNQIVCNFNSTEAVWTFSGGSSTLLPREQQTNTGNGPKGFIEIKSGTNILIDGNIFEGWEGDLVLTSRNQGNTVIGNNNPWSGLFNITISNNWWKKALNWDRIYGYPIGGPQLQDNEYTTMRSGPLLITNNLIDSGVENILFSMSSADNVTVTHNTYPGLTRPTSGSMIVGQGVDSPGFVFRDNFTNHNLYGLNCQSGGPNLWPGITATCGGNVIDGSEFKKNVLTDNRTPDQIIGDGPLNSRYPSNFINTDQSHVAIKWVNPATVNYRLASDSPYKNAASDGTDVGVSYTTLSAALGFDPSIQALTWEKVTTAPDAVTTIARVGTRLYAGHAAGVSYSDDNGTTWTALNTGFSATPTFVANMIPTSAGSLLASVRIAGVTQLWRLSGGTWSAITGTTSYYPGDQVQLANGNILRCLEYDILKSTNDGVSFTSINNTYFATSGGGSGYGSNAVYSIYQAPDGTVYAATDHDGVHYSTDYGVTWHWLGINATDSSMLNIDALKVNSAGQLLVGAGFGGVFVHTGAVSPLTCTGPPTCSCLPACGGWAHATGYPVTLFTVNNTAHDFLLLSGKILAHGGRMYSSTDDGTSYTLEDTGIPAGAINNNDADGTRSLFHHTMLLGPDGKAYVGIQPTGYGIYRTTTSVAGTVPTDPSGLTATAASSSQINLSWTDNSGDESGFKIERCAGAACSNFAEIATVSAGVTTYPNTGLTASTLYRYRVRAYNGTGNSGYSNTAEATTQAGSSAEVCNWHTSPPCSP